MSEQRFKKGDNLSCVDTETGKSYWYACNLCDLLNYKEQIIKEQHDEIINWTKKYVKLKGENEQLKNELRKEKSLREYSDSMYGADLIVNIRFSNGEWRADVSVIDDE